MTTTSSYRRSCAFLPDTVSSSFCPMFWNDSPLPHLPARRAPIPNMTLYEKRPTDVFGGLLARLHLRAGAT